MEVIIDGIVYVPKENKSKLEMLEEKYKSGNYICIGSRVGSNDKIKELDWPKWHANWEYKLIHKKHRNILDAWLADNSVEIECTQDISSLCSNPTENVFKVDNFINEYKEYFDYKIKPKQQYPIFKRNPQGEVFKQLDDYECVCYLSFDENVIGQDYKIKILKELETIPYDKERGLYHLQPVFFKGDTKISIGFYSVHDKHPLTEEGFHCLNHQTIEPITPEQLKVMPFVWDMYQQVLKDKQ